MTIPQWAQRHGLSQQALTELLLLLAMPPAPPTSPTPRSEAAAQAEIRLTAPRWGGVLWRNNVGALPDRTGVLIRYGLANDSKKLNAHVKSSDLIGFTPVAGRAVFVAIECKRADWTWGATAREIAQQRFHNIVRAGGGIAGFARNAVEFEELLRGEWV